MPPLAPDLPIDQRHDGAFGSSLLPLGDGFLAAFCPSFLYGLAGQWSRMEVFNGDSVAIAFIFFLWLTWSCRLNEAVSFARLPGASRRPNFFFYSNDTSTSNNPGWRNLWHSADPPKKLNDDKVLFLSEHLHIWNWNKLWYLALAYMNSIVINTHWDLMKWLSFFAQNYHKSSYSKLEPR